MTDVSRTGPAESPSTDDRLDSWKEIAAFLRRSTRTVQRWERLEGLPVHRLVHDKLGSVYAYRNELQAWWEERRDKVDDTETEEEALESDAVNAGTAPVGEAVAASTGEPGARRWVTWVGVAVLTLAAMAVLTYWRRPISTSVGTQPRLVILPFLNLTGDPDREYLSDGLTEEMITELGRLPELGVISRTSAMKYKRTDKGAGQIGRELNADYVLEGSVRQNDQRLRVTAQLIRVNDETHVWTDTFDRETKDLIAIQGEVSRRVAEEIRVHMPPPGGGAAVDPDAHLAYLRGRYHWNKRTLDGFNQGLVYFQQAIAKDPFYARAYSGLADTYLLMSNYGHLPVAEAMPKAKDAVNKALSLDESLAESHASLALMLETYDWNFRAAEAQFQRAIALNGNYATARLWYGLMLTHMGRIDEARAQFQRGLQADPLLSALAANLAYCDFYQRRYDKALERQRAILADEPDSPMSLVDISRTYLQTGRYPDALAALDKARALQGDDTMLLAVRGYALARAGRRAEAEAIIERLQTDRSLQPVGAYYLAIVFAGLGDRDQTMKWLEKVYEERHVGVLGLGIESEFDAVRDDPRFQELIRRVGLYRQ